MEQLASTPGMTVKELFGQGSGADMSSTFQMSHKTADGVSGTSPCSTSQTLATAKSGPSMDPAKPVVFQVGNLGPQYWEWVNQPEPGKPRFFGSSFAEACSKTAWWVVPLFWLPLFTAVLLYSSQTHGVSMAALTAWVLIGIVAWQGLEYVIHRYVFHADLSSYWGITFHFLFHGCHHKYPMDGERLVFPPVPASLLVVTVYAVLASTLPQQHALPLFAGMGYGYVAYDCLHYAIHHCGKGMLRYPLLRELQRRHMHHHYRDHSNGYGISSTLFDVLLGTSADL